MDFLLQPILSYLLLYKYSALFLVTLLGAIALPLPSAPSLMAAAAFASQGYLSLAWVFITASLANIIGDNLCYWLARKYGKPILYKLGFRKILESPTYDWIQTEIKTYKAPVVFFSRFNVPTTIAVNIIAGLSTMPYRAFLIYDVLGEILQVTMYVIIGYSFGANWQSIYNIFGQFSLIIILGLLLFMTILSNRIKRRLMHRRENHISEQNKKPRN